MTAINNVNIRELVKAALKTDLPTLSKEMSGASVRNVEIILPDGRRLEVVSSAKNFILELQKLDLERQRKLFRELLDRLSREVSGEVMQLFEPARDGGKKLLPVFIHRLPDNPNTKAERIFIATGS
jgi:hypothetical protein